MGVVKEAVVDVVEDAAEVVLRPRPGLAICSFCGGRIEIVMRILAPLVGYIALLVHV